MKNILIGGAWPYANGSLHIGHIAALLPGDILARYYRAKGDRVFYVSGSDCHGTPITIRARRENLSPEEISERYHKEFCEVFERLGFSYDLYTKTSDRQHKEYVADFHRQLYKSELIEERATGQVYCPRCEKVLTDRLVVGVCPVCGAPARGDQCDACGEVLDADTIQEPRCSQCGTETEYRQTTQLFILITRLREQLNRYLEQHPYWRRNAAAFTRRYINEGLRDRAITRDLDWGIEVPKEGYENKRIYIWAENVLGYLSASEQLCRERGVKFSDLFGSDARHYYIHGKDNIPFHTIILPSLLLAHGQGLRLPDDIISSEYVTLEGRRISTSQNWAVWAKDLLDEYAPDAIRYYFIANGPEKRDVDFTFREFREQNNSELVGAWGNLVNRTLAFIVKYLDGNIPISAVDSEVAEKLEGACETVAEKIERGNLKDALEEIFELIRFGNRYYDTSQPWKTRLEDPEKCGDTLFNCTHLIANIAVLLHPFLPFTSSRIIEWLGLTEQWKVQEITARKIPEDYSILFSRIE